MIISPCLMELFHLRLDAFLHLRFFLIEFSLQQFRAILHKQISIHQIELTCMGYLYNGQSSFHISLIVSALSQLPYHGLANTSLASLTLFLHANWLYFRNHRSLLKFLLSPQFLPLIQIRHWLRSLLMSIR